MNKIVLPYHREISRRKLLKVFDEKRSDNSQHMSKNEGNDPNNRKINAETASAGASSTATPKQNAADHSSILEEATFGAACATLIYIYADLRLFSATGYACTPFDHLMVDSDAYYGRIPVGLGRVPFPSANEPQSGLLTSQQSKRDVNVSCRTKSAANMLLDLLQELRREAASYRDREILENQTETLQSTFAASESAQDRRRRQRLRRRESAPMVFLAKGDGEEASGGPGMMMMTSPLTMSQSDDKMDQDGEGANNFWKAWKPSWKMA